MGSIPAGFCRREQSAHLYELLRYYVLTDCDLVQLKRHSCVHLIDIRMLCLRIARLFLRNSDAGLNPGDQVGLRLLQQSSQAPAATCITRGVKADSTIKGYSLSSTPGTKAEVATSQSSLTSLLMSHTRSRPADCWNVDAEGRYGTPLAAWY